MAGGGTGNGARPGESYAKVLANAASLVVALAGLAYVMANGRPAPGPGPKVVVADATAPAPALPAPKPPAPAEAPEAEPEPVPEPPKLDRAAVARAEESLDASTRDRARAEGRAEDAANRLAEATAKAAADASASKSLQFRVRDPSSRIALASAKGGFLKGDRDKLKGEIATLASLPKTKAKVLSNKNPVARPADGTEHHFEVRKGRVAYVDLDRLIGLVKADAQLRIRLSDGARIVDSRVGPVGPFALEYSLGRALPAGLEDLMERRGISYDLRAWEVVPEFEGRGETFEATRRPISEYARVINRLNPNRATITMWVYPDGFPLYRQLRDDLRAKGFLVAARPLPDGMAIRGSPSGSVSAGQ